MKVKGGEEAILHLHLSVLASTNTRSFPCGLLSRVYSDGHLSVCLGISLSWVPTVHRPGSGPGNSPRLALCFPPPPALKLDVCLSVLWSPKPTWSFYCSSPQDWDGDSKSGSRAPSQRHKYLRSYAFLLCQPQTQSDDFDRVDLPHPNWEHEWEMNLYDHNPFGFGDGCYCSKI